MRADYEWIEHLERRLRPKPRGPLDAHLLLQSTLCNLTLVARPLVGASSLITLYQCPSDGDSGTTSN